MTNLIRWLTRMAAPAFLALWLNAEHKERQALELALRTVATTHMCVVSYREDVDALGEEARQAPAVRRIR